MICSPGEVPMTSNSLHTGVAHRVPLGIHLFLLKLGKFSAVMDDHEQLPDEQEGKANQHDACYYTYHNGDDVRSSRALWNTDRCDYFQANMLDILCV